MAWIYTPDPMPPQQQPGYQHPMFFQQPQQPTTKKAKKASLKQLFRAKMQIEEMMKNVEEYNKKNKKEDKKKKDGLNWIELSLCLIVCSLPIAAIELVAIFSLAKVIPH